MEAREREREKSFHAVQEFKNTFLFNASFQSEMNWKTGLYPT